MNQKKCATRSQGSVINEKDIRNKQGSAFPFSSIILLLPFNCFWKSERKKKNSSIRLFFNSLEWWFFQRFWIRHRPATHLQSRSVGGVTTHNAICCTLWNPLGNFAGKLLVSRNKLNAEESGTNIWVATDEDEE